jgi:hypothetical protein
MDQPLQLDEYTGHRLSGNLGYGSVQKKLSWICGHLTASALAHASAERICSNDGCSTG